MKYIVLLGDGMSDYPLAELGNKTPLQYAATPNMDKLAKSSSLGMVYTVPSGYPPGSDVANLSVLGYDPRQYYTGRSPLEAISMGIELDTKDIAFRCNLVTLSEEENVYAQKYMRDYSAGEVSSEEAAKLVGAVNEHCGSQDIQFYPGISYRHLMVWSNGIGSQQTTPPHDIADRQIGPYLPQGEGADQLLTLMEESSVLLREHPVNRRRRRQGLNPANSIWLWGQGTKPQLPPFKEMYGVEGAMVSAVDLTKGIAMAAGLKVLEVPGATGNIHTNFKGKAQAALQVLADGAQFVYIHVEAPDEAGHQGDVEMKVAAIEAIDRQVLGEMLPGLASLGQYRLLLLPDHPTPISLKTHTNEPVPFLYHDSTLRHGGALAYDEKQARSTDFHFSDGPALMKYFLKK